MRLDGPVLETQRLILRPPQAEDFEAWAAFCADPEVMRFLGGVQTREQAWRTMAVMTGAWVVRGHSMFSIIEKSTGRWVGRLGPWQPEGWPGSEVGWGLSREAWGKGYASEGAAAAMDWAVEALGWSEVIHCIEPANTPSQAVARRLGSRVLRQATLPVVGFEVDCWGQSAAEWRARRAGGGERA